MNRLQKKFNLWYDSFPKMLYWWRLLFRGIRDTKLTLITFLLISMLFTLVFTSELLLMNFICSDTPCNQRTPSFVMIRKMFYIEPNACSWCDVNSVNMHDVLRDDDVEWFQIALDVFNCCIRIFRDQVDSVLYLFSCDQIGVLCVVDIERVSSTMLFS